MTLDEYEKEICIKDLYTRKKNGEKLEFGDLGLLASRHWLKYSISSLPDFEEMKESINSSGKNLDEKRLFYLEVQTDFKQNEIQLDQNDSVEEIMIDDWDFGKKCQFEIDLLEEQIKVGLQFRKSEGNKDALNGHFVFKYKETLFAILSEIEANNLHKENRKTLSAICLLLHNSKMLKDFRTFKTAENCIYEYFGRKPGTYKPNDLKDEIDKLKRKYHFFNELPSH